MGTGKTAKKHGARSKVKKYKRKVWLCRREKDIDQIHDEIEKADAADGNAGNKELQYDDELPGGGMFYCGQTGKHFIDAKALADHQKSKAFKRRIKDLKEEKYTQEIAEWAGGMTKEKLPSAHGSKKGA